MLQLARQLNVTAEQVEEAMAEFGEKASSHQDIIPPDNAELVAMSFGKTVTFSKAFQVTSHLSKLVISHLSKLVETPACLGH